MVTASALPDDAIEVFLKRRRRGSGVVRPPALSELLTETLEQSARLVPAHAGSLVLDDPTRPRGRAPLTFVAAFGPASERLIGTQVPAGRGVVGRVYQTGRTYTTATAARDPHFYAGVDERAGFVTRSLVAAPVRLERTVCGVLELVNRRGRRAFTTRDVELVELVARYVSRAILNSVDIAKRNELVFRDDLTGLRNLRGLSATLERSVRGASRRGEPTAVLYIDVDRLKRLNDRLGHRAGSEALVRVGRSLETALGDRGVAFRLGGDEFVAVCSGADAEAAERIAAEVRRAIREDTAGPMRWGGRLPGVSVSIGVAATDTSLRTQRRTGPKPGARLLAAADHALYRAKRAGRGRIERATRRDDTLGRTQIR